MRLGHELTADPRGQRHLGRFVRPLLLMACLLVAINVSATAYAGDCDGFCGGWSPAGCFCDFGCLDFSDCCDGLCEDCPMLNVCCDAGEEPANDHCSDADFAPAPLAPGGSYTFTGTNTCGTPECEFFLAGEGHVWIAFELSELSSVQLSYCGSVNHNGQPFGNAWLHAAVGCPCSEFTAEAFFSESCFDGNVEMTWGNLPAGVYYYPVLLDTGSGANGDYQITVTALGATVGCAGHCGEFSPAGCWCDSSCGMFSDCCEDFCDHCEFVDPEFCKFGPPPPTGCDGHCGAMSPEGCWCDEFCPEFNDCCTNFCDHCAHLDSAGFLCEPAEPEGCSIGFWKNHTEHWTGYSPDDLFCEVFEAPAGGPCAGFCGGTNPDLGCWCDNECVAVGDCCDPETICTDCPDLPACDGPPPGGPCAGFCGDMNPFLGCWCDNECVAVGDCCDPVTICTDCPDLPACDGPPPGGPCAGFCGDMNPFLGCWCDNECVAVGDCCDPVTICSDCPLLAACGGVAGDERTSCPFESRNLLEVLSSPSAGPNAVTGSPQVNNLGKQAVAALLNAASSASYPMTEHEVKSAVAAAYSAWAEGSHHSVLTSLQGELDANNNLGCPAFDEADLNMDAFINVFDLLEVLSAWGQGDIRADVNNDGVVNVFDLLIVLSKWGPAPVEWQPSPQR